MSNEYVFQEGFPRVFFLFSLDGRHFKAVYGKDMVNSLMISSDQVMSELERTPDDRLALQKNASTSLQGQISLLRSHQAVQDRRINFALAREAEEADGRVNERLVSVFGSLRALFFPKFSR